MDDDGDASRVLAFLEQLEEEETKSSPSTRGDLQVRQATTISSYSRESGIEFAALNHTVETGGQDR